MSPTEQRSHASRARWSRVPDPEQRRAQMRPATLASAVAKVVEHWPELTDAQQQRLRALLRPVPEGGGSDG